MLAEICNVRVLKCCLRCFVSWKVLVDTDLISRVANKAVAVLGCLLMCYSDCSVFS